MKTKPTLSQVKAALRLPGRAVYGTKGTAEIKLVKQKDDGLLMDEFGATWEIISFDNFVIKWEW